MAGWCPPLPLAAAVIREGSGRKPASTTQVARDERLAGQGRACGFVTRKLCCRKPRKVTPPARGRWGLLELDEPRAIEAVDAVVLAEMAGQCPQIPFGSDPLRVGPDLRRLDPPSRHGRAEPKQRFYAFRPFLRLERAGAINEGATGLKHIDRRSQQILLNHREARYIFRRFEMRYVGVPSDRAGRAARSIEENRFDRMTWTPSQCIGPNRLDRKVEPLKVGDETFEAAGRAIDRRYPGARGRELCGLAPRRSA